MTEDKVTLAHKRAELINALATKTLPIVDRVRIQGELSVINAKIKALNTTTAAQLKAEADRRKAVGLAEAKANAARALAKVNGSVHSEDENSSNEDDNLGQTAAIDGWIDAVLLRHDVDFKRSPDGSLMLAVPQKWHTILDVLIAGIYAAARGQELPDLSSTDPKAPKAPKTAKKRG